MQRRVLPTVMALAILTWFPVLGSPAGATEVELRTDRNEGFRVWVAGPPDARSGLLLVHDWFGPSPFLHEAVDALAGEGYRVIAVDLYGGKSGTTHKEAWDLMQALDAAQAARKIDAALAELAGKNRRVATIGFSMGAPYALEASMRHPDRVAATVIFYGDTNREVAELSRLGGPVLAIYGSKDGEAAADAAALSRKMDEAGQAAEVYVYPGAAHAFAQPLFNAGKTYDPVAARVAWMLTRDFLRRRLGS